MDEAIAAASEADSPGTGTVQTTAYPPDLPRFPFSYENGAYCFKLTKPINSKEYLIVQIVDATVLSPKFKMWLNTDHKWENKVPLGGGEEKLYSTDGLTTEFQFNPVKTDSGKRYIKVKGDESKHRVENRAWYLETKSGGVVTPMGVNVALQRLDILLNRKHFFQVGAQPVPQLQVVEDAAVLAGMAMMAYNNVLLAQWTSAPNHFHNKLSFYGGNIIKVVRPTGVKVKTYLDDMTGKTGKNGDGKDHQMKIKSDDEKSFNRNDGHEPGCLGNTILDGGERMDGGDLQLYAWEGGWRNRIYVVAIRGTDPNENWQIDLQVQAHDVEFKGYGSDVDPVVYEKYVEISLGHSLCK